MNTFNILDTEIGSPERKLFVKEIKIDEVTFNDGRTAEKLFLTCLTEDGEREFTISEAWSEKRNEKKVNGLWVQLDDKKRLVANSTLARMLQYYKVKKISDLKGKTIIGYPDPNGYMVLTTYDIKEEPSLFNE